MEGRPWGWSTYDPRPVLAALGIGCTWEGYMAAHAKNYFGDPGVWDAQGSSFPSEWAWVQAIDDVTVFGSASQPTWHTALDVWKGWEAAYDDDANYISPCLLTFDWSNGEAV